MKSRIILVIFLHFCILTKSFETSTNNSDLIKPHKLRHQEVDYQSNAIPDNSSIEREHKLLLECQHSDYRTYIKCLKREKRQHHGLEKRSCVDECFEVECNTSACLRDCHAHCRKRVIETQSKTVVTYDDCEDGSCNKQHSGSSVPNITTNVHIHNILPNVTNCKDKTDDGNKGGGGGGDGGGGGTGTGGGKGGTGTGGGKGDTGGTGGEINGTGSNGQNGIIPKIELTNIINNQLGSGSSSPDCSCPGCNCNNNPYNHYNPWQALPQITIGFGGGPIGGGCLYPMSWPCFQQRNPTPQIDCTICTNPFLRLQCNPICMMDNRKNGTLSPTQKPETQRINHSRRDANSIYNE